MFARKEDECDLSLSICSGRIFFTGKHTRGSSVMTAENCVEVRYDSAEFNVSFLLSFISDFCWRLESCCLDCSQSYTRVKRLHILQVHILPAVAILCISVSLEFQERGVKRDSNYGTTQTQ